MLTEPELAERMADRGAAAGAGLAWGAVADQYRRLAQLVTDGLGPVSYYRTARSLSMTRYPEPTSTT